MGNAFDGQFAPAVAVALLGLRAVEAPVDFLQSKLAVPRTQRIPRWAIYAAAGVLLLIALAVYAFNDLSNREAAVQKMQAQLKQNESQTKAAEAFVSKVTFAKPWFTKNARYVACLRDLTGAFPEDGATFATSLKVTEGMRTIAGKSVSTGLLNGTLLGKTSDQQRVQDLLDRIQKLPNFAEVKSLGTQEVGRNKEVSFSISFVYRP
jgi:hypothetical protein